MILALPQVAGAALIFEVQRSSRSEARKEELRRQELEVSIDMSFPACFPFPFSLWAWVIVVVEVSVRHAYPFGLSFLCFGMTLYVANWRRCNICQFTFRQMKVLRVLY